MRNERPESPETGQELQPHIRGALYRSAMETRRLGHAAPLSVSLLMTIIFAQALVTIPAQFRVIPAISLGGFLSLLFVLLLVMHFLMRPYVVKEARWPVFMFLLFIAWIAYGFIFYRLTVPGLQNTVIIISSILSFVVAAQVAKSIRAPTRSIVRAVLIAIWIPAVIYVLAIPVLGFGHTQIFAPRSLAGFLLIGIAIHCGFWRHGSRGDLWLALFLYAVVVLSLSRAAMGMGLGVFILAQMRLNSFAGWLRLTAILAAAVGLAAILLLNFEPLKQRFFSGDLSASVGGVQINTMGRVAAWTTVINSALEAPIVGKGPASSTEALANLHAGIEHPHNDYLRIWHDYGVIGVVLWFGAFGTMMVACRRQYKRFQQWGARETSLGAATYLAQITLLALMLTDNVLIYFYNMVPIFILSGLVLGSLPYAPLLRRPAG
ncbi:O-antigen ligase family protein [Nisaea acidiphila]|uniref:O-antigen ligase family protein n=1 Tax=Nisaea acidiphila TaxID=1862145 RepID=A0A9J7AXE3_9PROT|nr:O-antigen ligase family protein [Nisaea acidiphila]UUX52047.1 O-antigen ligase family protein [Nisaea acidiphila]